MSPIPWNDHATLVRTTDRAIDEGGRTIVAEAPLHRLVELADALTPAEVARHFITLPDRHCAPYRFDGEEIHALLGRLDRPGAAGFIVRHATRA